MRTISIGKYRCLQACADERGMLPILALDHRDSMREMIKPDDLDVVSAATLTEVKLDLVEILGKTAAAFLIDPIYGSPQAIAKGVLSGHQGIISSLEEQGYLGDPTSIQQYLMNGWSVEKSRRLGANGVKVLLYYHPDGGVATEKQEELVRTVVRECVRWDIPFFLEPLVYSLDRNVEKKSAEFAALRRDLVVRTAKRMDELGADILKMEFPVDCNFEQDRAVWADACAELDAAVTAPWVLLSAGVSYDLFKEQVEIARENGCSGFMVGRAVWREAATLPQAERREFLATTGQARWNRLLDVMREGGRPFTERYAPEPVDENWYATF